MSSPNRFDDDRAQQGTSQPDRIASVRGAWPSSSGDPPAGAEGDEDLLHRLLGLLWKVQIGHCGPIARRSALLLRRVLPVRGIVSLTHSVLGVPPAGRPSPALKELAGVVFELDLREGLHRGVYLDLSGVELRRLVLPLLRPGNLVVDVGANLGFWTLLAAQRGCDVIAVEPIERTRRLLCANIERNKLGQHVRVIGEALSDAPGALTLAVPGGESGEASAYLRTETAVEVYTVNTVTLDELVGDRSIRFLKVDVEGHEYAVLRGARRVLSSGQVDYVLIELVTSQAAAAGSSIGAIMDLLAEHGYEFVRFVSESAGFAPRSSYRRLSERELRSGSHAGDGLWRRRGLPTGPAAASP